MARTSKREFAVRRITVALDSSNHAQAALEAAADLAARLQAELEGVFVEDINLVRLAELPFAREVLLGGGVRPLSPAGMLREMEAEAARLHAALDAAATRARVRATFQRLRGQVAAEVLSAAGRTDLLILGLTSGHPGRGERAGSTALAAAARSARSVLIIRPGTDIGRSAVVLYDGSEGADKALVAAGRIAADVREALTVVLRAPDDKEAARLRAQARRILEAQDQPARFERAPAPSLVELCRTATRLGAGVLVLPADDRLLAGDDGYAKLLNEVRCPVLLVR